MKEEKAVGMQGLENRARKRQGKPSLKRERVPRTDSSVLTIIKEAYASQKSGVPIEDEATKAKVLLKYIGDLQERQGLKEEALTQFNFNMAALRDKENPRIEILGKKSGRE